MNTTPKEITPRDRVLNRMKNVLKNQGEIILYDKTTPFIDKACQMEVISILKQFVDNFEEYKNVIIKYQQHQIQFKDDKGDMER